MKAFLIIRIFPYICHLLHFKYRDKCQFIESPTGMFVMHSKYTPSQVLLQVNDCAGLENRI